MSQPGAVAVYELSSDDADFPAPANPAERPDVRGRLRLALSIGAAGCIAFLAALAFWPQPSPDPQAFEMTEQDRARAEQSGLALTPRPLVSLGDGASVVEALRSANREYGIVYRSSDGLKVLRGASEAAVTIEPVERIEQVLGYPLLADDGQTWAVDPNDPSRAFSASKGVMLVRTSIDGAFVFVRPEGDHVTAGITTHGVSGPMFDLPEGSEVIPVQGTGVLYRPPTGGTWQISGVEPALFSNGRVIAANSNAWLEQTCDAGITCTLMVHFVDDARPPVEIEGASSGSYSLSPDATSMLHTTSDGSAELFDLTGSVATSAPLASEQGSFPLDAANVAWSPDSSFFAWIADGRLHAYTRDGAPDQPSSDAASSMRERFSCQSSMHRSGTGTGMFARVRSRSETNRLGGTRRSKEFWYACPCACSSCQALERTHPRGPTMSRAA